ncbi:MAG: PIG-L family deacetylase [Bryobacterales bacterium]
MGHKVKFVAVTNGDIGHYRLAGGPLANRRAAEVQACAEILGIEAEVLDNHDGELMPTLENRKKIARLIREWQADVVLSPRPNDYHPDHRYTAILVQDAAFMVTVPFFTPDTPRVEKNPVFLTTPTASKKPYPFEADLVVGIDEYSDKKYSCMGALKSQFSEWNAWLDGYIDEVPKEEEARKAYIKGRFQKRDASVADKFATS